MSILHSHSVQFSSAFPSTLSSSFLVSRPTRSVDVVKLFCCLFAMMDEGSQLCFFLFFFLSDLLYFWSRPGHISPLYGQGPGCFCGITSLAASRPGGPVCPAPPGSDYTSKTTIFCEHDTACFSWCKTALCQCVLASWMQDVPEASRGF